MMHFLATMNLTLFKIQASIFTSLLMMITLTKILTQMTRAKLLETKQAEINMEGANQVEASLVVANMEGANQVEVSLVGANMEEVNQVAVNLVVTKPQGTNPM